MPFFFFISGMLYKQRKGGLKEALIKNTRSLLLPYLIFNLIFALIYGIQEGELTIRLTKIPIDILHGRGNNCKASWFIICLYFIKCAYDILTYTNIRCWGMVIVIILTFLPFHPHIFFYSSTILGLTFYHLGQISKPFMSSIYITWWKCAILSIFCFLLSYFLTTINGKISLFGGDVGRNILLFYLNAIIGSFGIICAAYAFRNRNLQLIVNISTASIGVVLLHMFFVDICKGYSCYFHSPSSLFLFYLFASVSIYAVCVIMYHITNRFIPQIWGKF